MIKEAKNVDFYTTGRQPSAQDFARISEWIEKDKQRSVRKQAKPVAAKKQITRQGAAKTGA